MLTFDIALTAMVACRRQAEFWRERYRVHAEYIRAARESGRSEDEQMKCLQSCRRNHAEYMKASIVVMNAWRKQ